MGWGSWHRPEGIGNAGLCFEEAGMLQNGSGRAWTAAANIGCSAGGHHVRQGIAKEESWLSGRS